jgi:hypothetical protein
MRLSNLLKGTNKELAFSILFLVVLIGGIFVKRSCEKSYLKDSLITKALVMEKSGGTFRSAPTIKVSYQLNGETVYSHPLNQSECFNTYSVGDSVDIKYSIENPEIVEIVGCN